MVPSESKLPKLHRLGSGPPVLVIHGGPGFDHRYLLDPLSRLSSNWQFIFYDQPGCGPNRDASPQLTLANTASQLVDIIGILGRHEPVRVIAHSWGVLVLAAAYARSQSTLERSICGGVLFNPIPLDSQKLFQSIRRFVATLPRLLLVRLLPTLWGWGDTQKGWQLLLPYYFPPQSKPPPIDVHLNIETYKKVLGSVGEFDHQSSINSFAKFACIGGHDDITPYDLVEPIYEACFQSFLLPDTGHFPLHEKPDQVLPMLDRSLKHIAHEQAY